MAIKFSCDCGKVLQVDDKFAGKKAKCPGCGLAVSVPASNGEITKKAPALPPSPKKAEKEAPWEKAKPKTKPPPMPEEDDDEEVLELATHAGVPIDEDDDFFVEAPAKIGKVLSAFTSLKKDKQPMALALRMVIVMIVFFFSFGLIAAFMLIIRGGFRPRAEDVAMVVAIPGLIALFLAGIVLWLTHFSHTCTYVGAKGIARYQMTRNRGHIAREEVFQFKDADELRIHTIVQYYNGMYTGTNYTFTWSDDKAKTIHVLKGRYSSEAGTPKNTDPFYYAQAAEMAWSNYLFRNIERLTTEDDLLFFGLTGGNHIEIGQGKFILTQGGDRIKLPAKRIEKMTIEGGVISVFEAGSKKGWFSNTGIHQFNYADLGNAQFFLFALEKFLGIRF